jgi:phage-related tail fiber protein
LDVKASVLVGTTANITLSGAQTIDGVSVVAGDRVLVKNQTTQADNGIYVAASGAWARSADANTWDELVSAYTFIEEGSTYADTGWVCTINKGGTLGTTPITWSQFSGAGTYLAGTGLTLSGNTFSITNTAVTAGSYGSASNTLTTTVNAQGQLTALAATPIAIANTQVSGLGTMSTQNANNVAITGGSIINLTTFDGITIDGGTF